MAICRLRAQSWHARQAGIIFSSVFNTISLLRIPFNVAVMILIQYKVFSTFSVGFLLKYFNKKDILLCNRKIVQASISSIFYFM